jgi:hypothetical protein
MGASFANAGASEATHSVAVDMAVCEGPTPTSNEEAAQRVMCRLLRYGVAPEGIGLKLGHPVVLPTQHSHADPFVEP